VKEIFKDWHVWHDLTMYYLRFRIQHLIFDFLDHVEWQLLMILQIWKNLWFMRLNNLLEKLKKNQIFIKGITNLLNFEILHMEIQELLTQHLYYLLSQVDLEWIYMYLKYLFEHQCHWHLNVISTIDFDINH